MTEEEKKIDPVSLPRLVFMGTPDFAIPSLRSLIEARAPLVLVVTQPDRPAGRGKKLTTPPVKDLAQAHGIPLIQPPRVKAVDALEQIRSYGAECAVVVAYGQILPQALLDMFPLGAINVHASLLPRYRGAAPIHRVLLEGEASTGVSIMLLDAGMDTGPVLSQKEIPIVPEDTLGSLHDKLAGVGASVLCETLAAWKSGLITPVSQNDAEATYAPPVRKEEWRLDWTQPARRLVNVVRAFDPFPGAFAFLGEKRLKCFGASLASHHAASGRPGEVLGSDWRGLLIRGGDGSVLAVGEVQWEGQKRLPVSDFLRGRPIPVGTILE